MIIYYLASFVRNGCRSLTNERSGVVLCSSHQLRRSRVRFLWRICCKAERMCLSRKFRDIWNLDFVLREGAEGREEFCENRQTETIDVWLLCLLRFVNNALFSNCEYLVSFVNKFSSCKTRSNISDRSWDFARTRCLIFSRTLFPMSFFDKGKKISLGFDTNLK